MRETMEMKIADPATMRSSHGSPGVVGVRMRFVFNHCFSEQVSIQDTLVSQLSGDHQMLLPAFTRFELRSRGLSENGDIKRQ